MMDIIPLTETYAVSPQIAPEDVVAIRDAGYTTIICNRPDMEIPSDLSAAAVREAAEAAGVAFVENPVTGGALTLDNVRAQGAAIDAAPGPVLAYCASGNRSSIVWSLSQAGRIPTDEMIAAAAQYGYALATYRDQIELLAQT